MSVVLPVIGAVPLPVQVLVKNVSTLCQDLLIHCHDHIVRVQIKHGKLLRLPAERLDWRAKVLSAQHQADSPLWRMLCVLRMRATGPRI